MLQTNTNDEVGNQGDPETLIDFLDTAAIPDQDRNDNDEDFNEDDYIVHSPDTVLINDDTVFINDDTVLTNDTPAEENPESKSRNAFFLPFYSPNRGRYILHS